VQKTVGDREDWQDVMLQRRKAIGQDD